jgi:hypothetical protein
MRSGRTRLMLNDLPKRSGVEELLPGMEYVLQRSDRILVHPVSDLPKAVVEFSDGSVDRIQFTGSCVLVCPADSFCLMLSFPRHLRALLTHSLGFTHNKPPHVDGCREKTQEETNPITLISALMRDFDVCVFAN